MKYERIEVKPYGGELGAVVSGVDLSQEMNDQIYTEIKQALLENLVIFFQNQDITPEQQISFGRRFGELHVHPYIPHYKNYKEIIELAADAGHTGNNRLANEWHVDLSYIQDPPLAAILRAKIVPQRGGDTMWCNLYKAYDTLSDTMKDMLEGLVAVHDVTKTYRRQELHKESGTKMYAHSNKTTPPVEHDVIKVHPETDKKFLYVSELTTTHIKGLHEHESDSILKMLFEHINWKELHCRFHWEKNSIAMWDNRATVHYAVQNYCAPRHMHRVTVLGEVFN